MFGDSALVVTDSHCHLTAEQFDSDRDEVIARAARASVSRIVTIASNVHDAATAHQLAQRNEGVWSTAGVHPHEVGEAEPDDLARIEAALGGSKVVAVGETGLDFHYDNAPRDVQRSWFESHLLLASKSGLPVVVHSRNADADVAEMIERFRGKVRGVVHCFTGARDLLDTALRAGWFIGYGGIATFKRFAAEDLVRAVPSDRLLLETDAPYLAPVPHRGKRNEPAFLVESLARIAAIRGEAVADLARASSENAANFFALPTATTPPDVQGTSA